MSNYSLADDLQARELTSAESARRELESEEKELASDCNELERQRSELAKQADELAKQADELRGRCSLLEQAKQQLTAEIERLKELLARAYKRGSNKSKTLKQVSSIQESNR